MSGVVRCNCFPDSCAPPPFPTEHLHVHRGDWDLIPELHDDADAEDAVHRWSRDCCPHRFLWAAEVWPVLSDLLVLYEALRRGDSTVLGLFPRPGLGPIHVTTEMLAGVVALRGVTLPYRAWPRNDAPVHLSEVAWLKGVESYAVDEPTEERPMPPGLLDRVLDAFETLCRAGLETHNPIVWEIDDDPRLFWRRVFSRSGEQA